jgi:hypothetical protein
MNFSKLKMPPREGRRQTAGGHVPMGMDIVGQLLPALGAMTRWLQSGTHPATR